MFSFIKGKIVTAEENCVTVETGGIGYEINVSSNTFTDVCNRPEVTLYTYLQVKEDGLALYGFYTAEEKRMFLNLITVSGVGCKVALSLLSGISLKDLAVSIADGDTAMLTRIKGIGKKTAERIILELKEKVSAFEKGKPANGENVSVSGSAGEAFAALSALGLKRGECLSAVKRASESGAKTAEEIISFALKNMGR